VGSGEPDLLGGAFGLTQAEQQVVHGLIRGHSPADIADALGLTVLTTRAHIKRAYAKLEVRCKEDLFVRLIGYLVH
jgi:DNA-binding CsgD family transcriptional regulator